ncbi:metallophosphoesterase family protein [uncultured Gimesia sp.]|uniref:metallophosphoesterase family protein n=1 Tax=uncultured Gimesia sp. TaxID=1678688 RepID=UPI0030D8976F|tara:strand:+ start:30669 stop:31481 length:813 start_codon:yes stop_codon:yes gene_type:complete
MKIIDFPPLPLTEFRYLNAGSRGGSFYEERLPIHHARVHQLPQGLDAMVVTADLQGRERFQESQGGPLRLLGEVVPQRLVEEVFPELEITDPSRVAALLAGDFYTVPSLNKRGGTGDVSSVWRAFGDEFAWVAGVAGNHDMFGESKDAPPRFSRHLYYLDGETVELDGLRLGGLGGIIGNPERHQRRSEEDYLFALELLLEESPDVLLMHDGPRGTQPGQQGSPRVRDLLIESPVSLVVRGHSHWDEPFIQFENGTQVLNVDARVVVLTA